MYTISEGDVRILFPRVTDTGIGIDPAKQRTSLTTIFQAESNISPKYGGTGLGLAIVKKLVEMMQELHLGGKRTRQGELFLLHPALYSTQGSRRKANPGKDSLSVAEHKLKGKILLVEDEGLTNWLPNASWNSWGLQVEIAQQGEEAIDMHRRNPMT